MYFQMQGRGLSHTNEQVAGFRRIGRFVSGVTRQKENPKVSNVNSPLKVTDFKAPLPSAYFVSEQGEDRSGSAAMKSIRVFALLGAGISGFLSFSTVAYSDEAEHGLECPSYQWPHQGILSSYDHASRRSNINEFKFNRQKTPKSNGVGCHGNIGKGEMIERV
ncbi:hypothetical protein L6452_09504 [Arctium lappa]|uniref:Uncharacterized protein n=1 Tax=Arctium lappa TaxID=4217 RepID=A0ACB9DKP2_ARCLA|nr:hypothetical protein L6452_09504 [Arctium lappa]